MRIALTVAAAVIALFSLGLVAVGGGLLWADSEKDRHGYLTTDRERFATDTYALATEDLDIGMGPAGLVLDDDRYGEVRLTARSADAAPVFVGVGPTQHVERYLSGVRHDVVTDLEVDPFRPTYREAAGGERPAPPAGERFWAASAAGPGTQALTWEVEDGSWSIVVMNADGSPRVRADVSAGAEAPLLGPLGWGALIAGLLGLGLAGGLAYLGLRTERPQRVAA